MQALKRLRNHMRKQARRKVPSLRRGKTPRLRKKRLARQTDREVRAILRGLLDELIASYSSDDRGIEIKEIAGGYRMATKPECHDAARMFVKSLKPVLKLSLPALETLAVIAYKQPVTAPEGQRDSRRGFIGRVRVAAGAQADCHRRSQAGDRGGRFSTRRPRNSCCASG